MSDPLSANESGAKTNEGGFSLVLGGPLHQLMLRGGLVQPSMALVQRRISSTDILGALASISSAVGANVIVVSEDAVRRLAYQKWEEAGKPNGDGLKFWLEAKEELSKAT